jgi:hypothetical protein
MYLPYFVVSLLNHLSGKMTMVTVFAFQFQMSIEKEKTKRRVPAIIVVDQNQIRRNSHNNSRDCLDDYNNKSRRASKKK